MHGKPRRSPVLPPFGAFFVCNRGPRFVGLLSQKLGTNFGGNNIRSGSLADITKQSALVRFVPLADISERTEMSALPPKADINIR